jgi:large subunit ribosomal protein L27Ae
MRQYRVLKNRLWRPAMNIDRLWSLVTEQHREVYKNNTKDVAPVIDLVRAVSFVAFSKLKYYSFVLLLLKRYF